MKRFLVAGVLTLCLITSQPARAAEDRHARIKAEMVENYLLWEVALKNSDAERLISLESPDFTYVTKSGSVHSKIEVDESLRKSMKAIATVFNARVQIKKLTIEPNRVVALTSQYIDYETPGPSGQLERFSTTLISRNIWVEYDRVWMLKRIEYLDWKVEY